MTEPHGETEHTGTPSESLGERHKPGKELESGIQRTAPRTPRSHTAVTTDAELDPIPRWLRTGAGWSWRLLLLVFVVGLVFWSTSQVRLVFIAMFIALVFTAILRPLVDLYARVMPRGLATGLGMLTAFLFVAGLLAYVVSSVLGQWSSLGKQFNKGINQIFDFLENGPLPISFTYKDFEGWLDNSGTWVQEHAGSIAGKAAEQAGSVFEIFTALALAIFTTIFFLARGRSMWSWYLGQIPVRARGTWDRVANAGWDTFSGYTRGTVIIALSDGAMAVILLLILGVPLAAPLGVLVFIGAFIPLVGAPAAMVIAMVVALAADGIWKAAIVGIGIALIGQFEGHVLQPLVMGKQVSLHPVVIAFAVIGGTLIAGILGAVIAVPLIGVAWTVFTQLRHAPEGGPPDYEEAEKEPAETESHHG